MNVLLTCAGRRNYLIDFFRQTLSTRGQVIACDSDPYAPALQAADIAFIVPPISDRNYFNKLRSICQWCNIGLLIPLNDLELPILAREAARFLEIGTRVVIASAEIVDLCFDKWKTYNFLKSCCFPTPNTYLSLGEARQALSRGDLSFPLVVKPRWGTASIGVEYPEDDEELELAYKLVKKILGRTFLAGISATDPEQCVLIQQRLHGQEHGLDVINDFDGHYVCTFAKRKLSMRAGETDRAITVRDEQLDLLGRMIGQKIGHIGILDCDVFSTEAGPYLLEMNPRFGGGYPFSHIAGANLPSALVAWANQEEVDPAWFDVKANMLASKYDHITVITYG